MRERPGSTSGLSARRGASLTSPCAPFINRRVAKARSRFVARRASRLDSSRASCACPRRAKRFTSASSSRSVQTASAGTGRSTAETSSPNRERERSSSRRAHRGVRGLVPTERGEWRSHLQAGGRGTARRAFARPSAPESRAAHRGERARSLWRPVRLRQRERKRASRRPSHLLRRPNQR